MEICNQGGVRTELWLKTLLAFVKNQRSLLLKPTVAVARFANTNGHWTCAATTVTVCCHDCIFIQKHPKTTALCRKWINFCRKERNFGVAERRRTFVSVPASLGFSWEMQTIACQLSTNRCFSTKCSQFFRCKQNSRIFLSRLSLQQKFPTMASSNAGSVQRVPQQQKLWVFDHGRSTPKMPFISVCPSSACLSVRHPMSVPFFFHPPSVLRKQTFVSSHFEVSSTLPPFLVSFESAFRVFEMRCDFISISN